MPEIRYIVSYEYPEDLPAEQKVPANAKITKIPYVVSDEELAEEKRIQRMANILEEIDALKEQITAIIKEIDKLKLKVDDLEKKVK